jgi:hypothetical protein
MTHNTIQLRSEFSMPVQSQDWFDDHHESVLILQGRDSEENGVSPESESSRISAFQRRPRS